MSQLRRNFITIDANQGFTCERCGGKVFPLGTGSYRNHCPYCLWTIHVDDIPGDRREDCKGLMEPIDIDYRSSKGYIVIHKCVSCGTVRRNKLALDDPDQPDNFNLVLELMKRGGCHRLLCRDGNFDVQKW